MGLKATIGALAADWIVPGIYKQHKNAVHVQDELFWYLIEKAAKTEFGKKHEFEKILNYEDFKKAVPISDYEDLKPYIERIAMGYENVLWPGMPLYFCKSSGTTSGTKYIPLTKPQIKDMIEAARNSLLMYIQETGNSKFFDKKMIFLQGSPELETYGVVPTGRLSGITYRHVPGYLNANRMPRYKTNCIEDWEGKVDAIARETMGQPMSLISGIPPWVVMYFERLLELTGKQYIKDVFPDFKLFAYGGVNYEPYRARIESLVGFKIDSVETYPASEGFIAYQDSQKEKGLLLNLDGGVFYEFVKAEDIHQPNPERICIEDVEVGVNYALILNTNAGLWGYSIGDTIKFVSKDPYRILVTGRVKHFISAFGEHVIGEEVEYAIMQAAKEAGAEISEFTVAPMVSPDGELPYHEWWVEFNRHPDNFTAFAERIDKHLQQKNTYYADLREGNVLQQLKVRPLKQGAFVDYMKAQGKLGGQNKVPRLTNDRKIADELTKLINS